MNRYFWFDKVVLSVVAFVFVVTGCKPFGMGSETKAIVSSSGGHAFGLIPVKVEGDLNAHNPARLALIECKNVDAQMTAGKLVQLLELLASGPTTQVFYKTGGSKKPYIPNPDGNSPYANSVVKNCSFVNGFDVFEGKTIVAAADGLSAKIRKAKSLESIKKDWIAAQAIFLSMRGATEFHGDKAVNAAGSKLLPQYGMMTGKSPAKIRAAMNLLDKVYNPCVDDLKKAPDGYPKWIVEAKHVYYKCRKKIQSLGDVGKPQASRTFANYTVGQEDSEYTSVKNDLHGALGAAALNATRPQVGNLAGSPKKKTSFGLNGDVPPPVPDNGQGGAGAGDQQGDTANTGTNNGGNLSYFNNALVDNANNKQAFITLDGKTPFGNDVYLPGPKDANGKQQVVDNPFKYGGQDSNGVHNWENDIAKVQVDGDKKYIQEFVGEDKDIWNAGGTPYGLVRPTEANGNQWQFVQWDPKTGKKSGDPIVSVPETRRTDEQGRTYTGLSSDAQTTMINGLLEHGKENEFAGDGWNPVLRALKVPEQSSMNRDGDGSLNETSAGNLYAGLHAKITPPEPVNPDPPDEDEYKDPDDYSDDYPEPEPAKPLTAEERRDAAVAKLDAGDSALSDSLATFGDDGILNKLNGSTRETHTNGLAADFYKLKSGARELVDAQAKVDTSGFNNEQRALHKARTLRAVHIQIEADRAHDLLEPLNKAANEFRQVSSNPKHPSFGALKLAYDQQLTAVTESRERLAKMKGELAMIDNDGYPLEDRIGDMSHYNELQKASQDRINAKKVQIKFRQDAIARNKDDPSKVAEINGWMKTIEEYQAIIDQEMVNYGRAKWEQENLYAQDIPKR